MWFVVECTRYEREVKSRQINEEKAKTETRRDGFANTTQNTPSFRRASDTVALVCTLAGSLD